MSFLYPRTITISRQQISTGGGVQAYGGVQQSLETVIFTGVSAAIQYKNITSKPTANMPSDVRNSTYWLILIPLSAGVTGLQRGDIVTDDAGQRYRVVSPYVGGLGPNLLTERLEA